MVDRDNLDTFTLAYIECMLWSTLDTSREDEGGNNPHLDENHTIDDISDECMKQIIEDCKAFQESNEEWIDEEHYIGSAQYNATEMAGHDFWLTREGHGAGFWDGDWSDKADKAMTECSDGYGSFDVYVGDDGKIYN